MKKPQLFLLHFAGGNVHSFQFLYPLLKDFEVISLELPGRGKRIRESLLTDFDEAALDIYQQIKENLTASGFMIYGHSMGAYLALRVANMLEKEHKYPDCIVVSGNPGPGVKENKQTYLLERQEFITAVQKLGGIPQELIEHKELFDFFEPILRADFEVAEDNRMINEPAVGAAIYAVMGTEEETNDKITNWSRYTRSDFDFEILEGHHFFIHNHPFRIAEIISSCYCKAVLSKLKVHM
jgi:surfactin synthase thioesterase subunit